MRIGILRYIEKIHISLSGCLWLEHSVLLFSMIQAKNILSVTEVTRHIKTSLETAFVRIWVQESFPILNSILPDISIFPSKMKEHSFPA